MTALSLLLLFFAVQHGLLGNPEMQIGGNGSTAYQLNWYQDRNSKLLPTATVVSVPLFVYRLLMLACSLWLAVSLLNCEKTARRHRRSRKLRLGKRQVLGGIDGEFAVRPRILPAVVVLIGLRIYCAILIALGCRSGST